MKKSLLVVLSLVGGLSVSSAQAAEFLVAALQQVETSQTLNAQAVEAPKAACKVLYPLAVKQIPKAPPTESWTDGLFEESDGIVIATFACGVVSGLVYCFCF